jgi:hypothetical protein
MTFFTKKLCRPTHTIFLRWYKKCIYYILKMVILWVVAPRSLVEAYRRFRGAYCLHHRPDDGGEGGSKHLWNVGKLLSDYTAQQPRRQPSSFSQPYYILEYKIRNASRFEVLTALKMSILVLWVVTPCGQLCNPEDQHWKCTAFHFASLKVSFCVFPSFWFRI